jgi:WD domain, G-beta repeat/TIR domain
MPKITISYRRADSEAITGRIFDRLIAHFGKETIFRDIEDIPPGIDFRHHINETLLKTNILLAIIGPRWLGAARGSLERIHEESDPVRVEVETALRRRVPIIPVLIGKTRMPSSDQLPPSLKDFAFRNAVNVDTGRDFDHHMDRLIRSMDAILRQAPKSPPSRETAIPASPPKTGTAERAAAAAAAMLDVPHKKATGSRAAAAGASPAKEDAKPFSFPLAVPPAWREILWPKSQGGRKLRLGIAAGAAVLIALFVIVTIFVCPGCDRRQRLLTLTGHSAAVTAVAFSPNARIIVSGSLDRSVRIWDAANGRLLRTLTGDSDGVTAVAFLPSGQRIASGSLDRSIVIWDTTTGQSIRALRFDPTYAWEVPPAVWSIAVSPDGTRIVSGSADASVKIWSEATGDLLRNLKGHGDVVTSVAYFPNGKTIASGSKDGTVRLWDAESGQQLRVLNGHPGQVLAVAVSPDGKLIAAAGSAHTVIVWNIATGQQLTLTSDSSHVESVAFSIDGKRIAGGGNDTNVDMWDATSGQLLRSLTGHSGSVRAIAFSPDDRRFASGSEDKTIDIWPAN